jgi:hypothetical protein
MKTFCRECNQLTEVHYSKNDGCFYCKECEWEIHPDEIEGNECTCEYQDDHYLQCGQCDIFVEMIEELKMQ